MFGFIEGAVLQGCLGLLRGAVLQGCLGLLKGARGAGYFASDGVFYFTKRTNEIN